MKSKYVLLARLRARFEIENMEDIGDLIKNKHEHNREIRRKLIGFYDYIPEKHQQLFSPHSIARNLGCGCKLCRTMHEYAKSKLHLHYIKRTFNADFGVENLIMHNETNIPVEANFYALYSEYQVKTKENYLTELEFYNKLYIKKKEEISEKRKAYKAIKDSISHILSE